VAAWLEEKRFFAISCWSRDLTNNKQAPFQVQYKAAENKAFFLPNGQTAGQLPPPSPRAVTKRDYTQVFVGEGEKVLCPTTKTAKTTKVKKSGHEHLVMIEMNNQNAISVIGSSILESYRNIVGGKNKLGFRNRFLSATG